MKSFLASLSRGTLAFGVIAVGILFIVLSDPPHTVCGAQFEVFKGEETPFLFADPKDKVKKTGEFDGLISACRESNGPGGCYDLFFRLKRMSDDLLNTPAQCRTQMSEVGEVKKAVWQSLELLARIAWGSRPPGTYSEKFGWLDPADLALFCTLKDRALSLYGKSAWDNFQEKMFKELPGAGTLPRQQVWEKMLLSYNCP